MGLLSAYGVLASLQSDPHFGRVLAAYGGVFVAGSLLWAVVFDQFRPLGRDLLGVAVCLCGTAVIMAGR
jgi:small multidrug resistance family-3 protein